MAALAPYVCGFSDDGRGVQDEALMRLAMQTAKQLDRPILAHCEDENLLRGGYIHEGAYAKAHGHRGIPSQSEWGQLARDLQLVAETGCAYHMCHVSTKESVALLREGKRRGLPVTAETAPHYLLLTDADLQEDGRFKMNPPLRSADDRSALLEGVLDGTIDCIATDHAPHTRGEKSGGLKNSAFGIVGLETAFPLLYTYLVREGVLSLGQLVALMSHRPRALLERWSEKKIPAGEYSWNLDARYTIAPDTFFSKGRATPFDGWEVYGKIKEETDFAAA
jgi:dihydroorotase